MVLQDYLEMTKDNIIVHDAFTKAASVLYGRGYKSPTCSISGGSDSDIVLDLIRKVDTGRPPFHPMMRYIYFDTGLEYQATKDHIDYLKDRYGINIYKFTPKVTIPKAVREHGQPFISKFVAGNIDKLQRSGFKFEDESFEYLQLKYPNAKSAIKWWCNKNSRYYNIDYVRYLKDFLILNPPKFKISAKCCDFAKKDVAHQAIKNFNIDLEITGIRKAEGGIRKFAYDSCFSSDEDLDTYRPLFWFTNADKQYYKEKFNIVYSDCYEKYGFTRTGCACCPFGSKDIYDEMIATKEYEPKLWVAVQNVFGESLEYTQQWKQYQFDRRIQERDKN